MCLCSSSSGLFWDGLLRSRGQLTFLYPESRENGGGERRNVLHTTRVEAGLVDGVLLHHLEKVVAVSGGENLSSGALDLWIVVWSGWALHLVGFEGGLCYTCRIWTSRGTGWETAQGWARVCAAQGCVWGWMLVIAYWEVTSPLWCVSRLQHGDGPGQRCPRKR